ncbi:MAG TPA: ABC transporter ATP-binding protein [Acidimicrobiales bacterium]|jgi:putative ABC transport system ATP-binding protein|nr:ABC transporter ATP-binding protein [Acidimicrobiales bacterium]
MLKVKNLNKTFRTPAGDVHAVRDVSFDADNGEMVAIVGASGSGKSTLLALLGLLDAPDNGSIDLDGVELASLDGNGRTKYRSHQVGFVFQQFNLIPNLSAKENVLLALEYSHWPKADRARRADEMLDLVGLNDDKAQRRPARLSGGEQQRVAIARAFAAQPQLILADEPTGSLDKSTGQKIVELLRSAASTQRATVLVVTHDDKVARQADRRFEIDDGVMAEVS